jgi:Flp pilus assembly protein TadG
MTPRRIRSVYNDICGGTALEMAFVMPILVPMLLGPLELGLFWWTDTTLQSVANVTARCVAINNPACTTTQTPAAYAVSLATTWSNYAVIGNADVSSTTVATCNGATGAFEKVTIQNHQWSTAFTYPFKPTSFTLTACYPN